MPKKKPCVKDVCDSLIVTGNLKTPFQPKICLFYRSNQGLVQTATTATKTEQLQCGCSNCRCTTASRSSDCVSGSGGSPCPSSVLCCAGCGSSPALLLRCRKVHRPVNPTTQTHHPVLNQLTVSTVIIAVHTAGHRFLEGCCGDWPASSPGVQHS